MTWFDLVLFVNLLVDGLVFVVAVRLKGKYRLIVISVCLLLYGWISVGQDMLQIAARFRFGGMVVLNELFLGPIGRLLQSVSLLGAIVTAIIKIYLKVKERIHSGGRGQA